MLSFCRSTFSVYYFSYAVPRTPYLDDTGEVRLVAGSLRCPSGWVFERLGRTLKCLRSNGSVLRSCFFWIILSGRVVSEGFFILVFDNFGLWSSRLSVVCLQESPRTFPFSSFLLSLCRDSTGWAQNARTIEKKDSDLFKTPTHTSFRK